jgi:hypothetical protein
LLNQDQNNNNQPPGNASLSSAREQAAESSEHLMPERAQYDSVYLASLKATAPLAPITALVSTVFIYILIPNAPEEVDLSTTYGLLSGPAALACGVLATVLIWLVLAALYSRYTTAAAANPYYYSQLREKYTDLSNRVRSARSKLERPQETTDEDQDRALDVIRSLALNQAGRQVEEIYNGLRIRGMPWVNGIGYVELWRRVHNAEQALIKVEPSSEALAGAIRDASRLIDANMNNKDLLLRRLIQAVATLDVSVAVDLSSLLDESERQTFAFSDDVEGPDARTRAKALATLSEVRYEIDLFQDRNLEGIARARNRLTNTSGLLGVTALAFLGLAILAHVPQPFIIWVSVFFLVGVMTALFARAHAEWTAGIAVDDFGLSTARLVHIPLISGIAAVGGVLLTALLDNNTNVGASTFAEVLAGRPSFIVFAAIYGLAPDLLVRRLGQQVEQYREDWESTQISSSHLTVASRER